MQEYLEDGEEIINEDELANFEQPVSKDHTIVEQSTSYTKSVTNLPVFGYNADKTFEQNLVDFFTKYRRSKLKHVPAIVKEFAGREQEAFSYLYFKYVTRVDAIVNRKPIPIYGKSGVEHRHSKKKH